MIAKVTAKNLIQVSFGPERQEKSLGISRISSDMAKADGGDVNKTKRVSICPECMGMGVIFEKTVYDSLVQSARSLAEYSVEDHDSDFQKCFEDFQKIISEIEGRKS